jgi:hypothetical protein
MSTGCWLTIVARELYNAPGFYCKGSKSFEKLRAFGVCVLGKVRSGTVGCRCAVARGVFLLPCRPRGPGLSRSANFVGVRNNLSIRQEMGIPLPSFGPVADWGKVTPNVIGSQPIPYWSNPRGLVQRRAHRHAWERQRQGHSQAGRARFEVPVSRLMSKRSRHSPIPSALIQNEPVFRPLPSQPSGVADNSTPL